MDNALMSKLKSARHLLQHTVAKSQVLASELDMVQSRFQSIRERLPDIEAALNPIRERSHDAHALGSRLDQAMAPAAFILEKYEAMHSLEGTIRGNPKEDIGAYLLAVSQLEEVVHFLSGDRNTAMQQLQEAVQFVEKSKLADDHRIHRLKQALAAVRAPNGQSKGQGVDNGLKDIVFKKLEKEFLRLLAENSKAIPLPLPLGIGEKRNKVALPFSVSIVQILQAIVKRMEANGEVDRCAKPFVELRSGRVRESLLALQAKYLHLSSVKAVDVLDWATLESYIGDWTQHIELAVRILYAGERLLCWKVFASLSAERKSQFLGNVAHAGMTSFLQFGESVARSEKAPEKLFKLLDMFETLENLDQSMNEVFEGDGCQDIRHRVRELRKQIVHAACQVFRELGSQIEMQKEGPLPPDGGIFKLSSYVVNYIKYLASEFYSPIMNQLLQIEQSWRLGSVKEGGLPPAVLNMMELLERTLLARSKGYKDASLAHIFLINNYYYMYTRSKSSELGPLLGNSWLKDCKSKVQQHALAYQKESWGKVLSHLSRDGLFLSTNSRVASRDLVKQRLKAFTASFEETFEQHRKWIIADAELREATKVAVIQSVVPAYRSYIQNYGPLLEMGGSSSKYMKFLAEDVEQMLENIFQEKIQKTSNGVSGRIHANGS
ncbi:hypothetical protein O6H91_13G038000 [Diphasiastrum complanatum]|uniref:Uncharacterized protein n=1 Tax=Diphasiastrum complanatum TaxID=34168 RepID=A0ACC2BTV8_DIPCM|nr:hypothetical protein O6H91_Y476100 [Diphasiastrum complanatum]KAJ7533217.1 hypothetical protein O6H91_13G038000 [Diphasiastrum complanatum]